MPATKEGTKTGLSSLISHTESVIEVTQFWKLASQPQRDWNDYIILIGMKPRPTDQLLEAVEEGFPFEAFKHFQNCVGWETRHLAELLRIPNTTLQRRRASGRLDFDESERLLRMSRLFAAALELFEGDVAAARQWMSNPKRALNNATPFEMAQTEIGAQEVAKLIDRLEHGVYS